MDEYDIDEATGLPRLPAGDRWFVSSEYGVYHGVVNCISWQTPTTRFAWTKLRKVPAWESVRWKILPLGERLTAKSIFLTAKDIINSHNKAQAAFALLGAYPPKSL